MRGCEPAMGVKWRAALADEEGRVRTGEPKLIGAAIADV
jgi:hypothetical protein